MSTPILEREVQYLGYSYRISARVRFEPPE